ncbi:hypothetical protein N9L02_02240, partial [Gammaproteobacteria bacterium]|nr:hypothetical protein [Gammaproteobacteria bacterium]
FVEFFEEYSTDEITQTWGITFPQNSSKESIFEIFENRFNILIKRLNNQLISRLHQERNHEIKSYIKDFPLHIEQLKEKIAQLLKALMLNKLNLQGVYLTSSTQETENEEHSPLLFIPNANNNFEDQALQIMSTPPSIKKSYFTKQLLLSQLQADPINIKNNIEISRYWQKRIIYTSSISAVSIALILLGYDFNQSLKQTTNIQKYLAEYQLQINEINQKGGHLVKALPLVNNLKASSENPANTFLLNFYAKKSQKNASIIYTKALHQIIIPEIKKYLESSLQNYAQNLPEINYAILKSYLMLQHKNQYQSEFMTNTIFKLMPKNTNKETIEILTKHITMAIKTNPESEKLNQGLISRSRESLNNTPSEILGIILLSENEPLANTTINLNNNLKRSSIFISSSVPTNIPWIYTASGFNTITKQAIPKISTEIIKGNWVLGKNNQNTFKNKEIAKQLHDQYITNYINYWELLLAKIKIKTPENLDQLNQTLTELISSQSPLLVLLDTFKQNTDFISITDSSEKLRNISYLLADTNTNQTGGLYGIFVGLRQLQNYIEPIIQSNDKNKTIFEASAKRMQDSTKDPITQLIAIKETSPEPMKTWLNNLATNTWHLMIKNTGEYIQNAWQQNIMLTYHASIENNYPFDQKSGTEVDLNQFINFFSPNGKLSNFYQIFLKPFTYTAENRKFADWLVLNNEKISTSDKILKRYKSIKKIQQAFFPNGDNKLYVPFSLQPITLDKSLKTFTLNINGQEVIFEKNNSKLINWPGAKKLHATTINFVTPENKLISETIDGNWGWFKLVTQSTKKVTSSKEINLAFKVNNHIANYKLFTQGPLNPFLPLNFDRFKLDETIV